MNRNRTGILIALTLIALLTAAACATNKVLPKQVDKTAMEADVRGAIATAVPNKTFAIEVNVHDGGVVALSGHVDSASDRDAIIAKVRGVDGVRSVDASGLTVG
ncbi:MAG: BON domain-containing protein [Acidobacteria bacterium]|nr:BON domain-containing protein [Acidobacteriota bacterium]MBV9476761.1 BON domain-containing protein [Acidobacteriota bacterium]